MGSQFQKPYGSMYIVVYMDTKEGHTHHACIYINCSHSKYVEKTKKASSSFSLSFSFSDP